MRVNAHPYIMTDVTFTFKSESRSLKRRERCYVGQAFDSLSTTLHFEYDPIDFLSGNSDLASEGYVPYIMFRVYDDTGAPLVYSTGSTPRFDGYTFDIPWEVTSRVKSPSVEFQLFFVRNNVDFSGDIAQLDSTEYILSNIASVAFSSTIRSKPGCNPCYPSNPQTEPGLMGWTNFFKDFSVLVPVKASLDESIDRIAFDFRTYLGRNDCHVPLNVPYLDSSGTVPAKFLKMITKWYSDSGLFLPTDENLPSALLVHSSLVEKTDRTMAIAPWYENLEYNIGSTVIGSDGRIYRSLQEHNIGNNPIESELWQRIMEYDAITDSWNEEPKSDMVPSERLVYYALMEKADKVMPVYPWQSNWTYDIGALVLGSDGRVYRSLLQSNIGNDPTTTDVWTLSLERMDIATQWNDPTSDTLIPSEKLVKDSLDRKTDITQSVPWWSPDETYGNGAVVIFEWELYISQAGNNLNHHPPDDETWWKQVRSSDPTRTDGVVTRVIGDGSASEFTIRHGFGSYDVFWEIRFTEGGRSYTDAKVSAVSENHLRIEFTSPPETNEFTVVVSPATASKVFYKGTLGDGIESSFDITHHFGTHNFLYGIRRTDGERDYVDAKVSATGFNTARVEFTEPPSQDEFTIFMVPFTVQSDSDFVYEQAEPSDVWTIEHPLGKLVSVYLMDSDGEEIHGQVSQDVQNMNLVTVKFCEAISGIAIIR